MIEIKDGRARSYKTHDEEVAALKKEIASLSGDEQKALMEMLKELEEGAGGAGGGDGDDEPLKPTMFQVLSEQEYKHPPVDIETFVKDPYYLGNTCDNLYPKLLEDLIELFSGDYHECIFTGSIGYGKTFAASIGVCRVLYELSCLKNPHKTYSLAKDSNISIVALSVNETLATKVVFENIATKLTSSPYFKEQFPFEVTKKEMRFPNSIWIASRATTDTSALGLNTIGCLLDETNFIASKSSKYEKFGVTDHAETIYNSIKRRMKSRFEKQGKLPGMLFVVSSKKTSDDFTARRINTSKTDPQVFVRDYPLWGVKPEDYYSAKKFWVVVGNEQTPSRIVRTEEEKNNIEPLLPEDVLLSEVPEDFLSDFEKDIEGSIRDLLGQSTVAIAPFIQRREKILEAIDESRNHPFSVGSYDPSKPGSFLWDTMVGPHKERDMVGGGSTVRMRPLVSPTAPRHIHIDPSLRGDATGITMAHIAGWKDVRRRTDDNREYLERAPIYYVDFMLQVIPPVGDEIVLGEIRRLIYDLSAHGYLITCISLDSWQSADTMQQFKQRGYQTLMVSVDTSLEPYENLKTALYENRVAMYGYEPILKELRQLEKDNKKKKIDHPAKGGKDVSDSLAGALFTLSTQQTSAPLPILRGSGYTNESWMTEQQQAIRSPASIFENGANSDMPLPFLTGNGGGRGNDGEGNGGGGGWGFGI